MGRNSEGEGEDIHGTEQGRGKTYMGRNSEGEGVRHTWDGTVKGKG